jgi:hypothetical protein
MDWLTFISTMTGHLAWPIAVFASAVLFRAQIVRLFASVKKLKWKDFEAEFDESAERIFREFRSFSLRGLPAVPVRSDVLDLIDTSPSLAFLDAWKVLEQAIIQASVRRDTPPSSSIRRHIETLFEHELIDPGMRRMLVDIYELRNKLVHTPNVNLSKATVYEMVDIMGDVTAHLQRITGN